MSILFHVVGTQLDALRTQALKTPNFVKGNAGVADPNVVADSGPGVLGESVINVHRTGVLKALMFQGRNNLPTSGGWSVLYRIVPRWTGNPASTTGLLNIGRASGDGASGLTMVLINSGSLVIALLNKYGGAPVVESIAIDPAVSGTAYEFFVTWDGTTNANGFKVYVNGVLAGQYTASGDITRDANDVLAVTLGLVAFTSAPDGDYDINEFAIWDGVVALPDFNRTEFLTDTAFEGGLNIFPTQSQIESGASYVEAGTEKTGTYEGLNRFTDPGIENVATGIEYLFNDVTQTGTSDEPSPSDVREGVLYDNDTKTGTLVVPDAADVRLGTVFDNGTEGTCAVPSPADVLSGVAVDDTVGTLEVVEIVSKTQVLTLNNEPGSGGLVLTPGDDREITMVAKQGDLTGATLTTYLPGNNGTIEIPDSDHEIDPDQTTNPGKFTVRISAEKTSLLKLGAEQEIITKVAYVSTVIHYRGENLLDVRSSVPV